MEILLYIALAWFLTNFEPLQDLIDRLFTEVPLNRITMYLHGAFGCPKCMGFWVTWALSGQFLTACLVSLCSYVVDLCLAKLNY
jgi:hypothetical protein